MILATQSLAKNFGGLQAVDGVSFEVHERAIQSIIGPNGAGKTTLFNLITGAIPPASGRVTFLGEDVTGSTPNRLARRGLVRTFQRTSIFRSLSAIENVRLAVRSRLDLNLAIHLSHKIGSAIDSEAFGCLAEVGLKDLAATPAGLLAHGNQRALDIAIGLALRPKLILMDEPMAGMSRGDRERIAELVVRLRDEHGLTIVIVEHDIGMVMRLSDRITVMQNGRMIAEGSPAAIRENPDVKKAYLHGSFVG